MVLLQLTDLHISKMYDDIFMGQSPYRNLTNTIDKIIETGFNADLLLVTGDISNDGSNESYELAIKQLIRLNLPIYFTPGNHDNKDALNSVFSQYNLVQIRSDMTIDGWDFISIDTTVEGSDSGFITPKDLLRLNNKTSNNTVIIMHHHPTPVETPLVDECMLINNDELMSTIKLNNSIKLIICGHAHGDYKIQLDQCMIEVCPATCFQWTKGTKTLSIENNLGFKRFEFTEKKYFSESFIFSSL